MKKIEKLKYYRWILIECKKYHDLQKQNVMIQQKVLVLKKKFNGRNLVVGYRG